MSSSDPAPDLRPVNMDDFLKAIPTVKRTGNAAEQYAQEGLNGTAPYLTINANSLVVGKLFLIHDPHERARRQSYSKTATGG